MAYVMIGFLSVVALILIAILSAVLPRRPSERAFQIVTSKCVKKGKRVRVINEEEDLSLILDEEEDSADLGINTD